MKIFTTEVETTMVIYSDSISISGAKNCYLKRMEILGVVKLLSAGCINWTAKRWQRGEMLWRQCCPSFTGRCSVGAVAKDRRR